MLESIFCEFVFFLSESLITLINYDYFRLCEHSEANHSRLPRYARNDDEKIICVII